MLKSTSFQRRFYSLNTFLKNKILLMPMPSAQTKYVLSQTKSNLSRTKIFCLRQNILSMAKKFISAIHNSLKMTSFVQKLTVSSGNTLPQSLHSYRRYFSRPNSKLLSIFVSSYIVSFQFKAFYFVLSKVSYFSKQILTF